MNINKLTTGWNSLVATASKGLVACVCLTMATAGFAAGTVRIWVGTANNNLLGTANNWNPSGAPNSGVNDTLQFNGSQAGNLLLTNGTVNFDSSPGFYINVTAAQAGSVSI